MTFPSCSECDAPLGPWEGRSCLSHQPARARTIADQAVLVLERELQPIYLHDLQRGIGREVGRRAEWQSVSAVVGADRRFCWSGKGMYGLFRHGRIPWARTLADVASFILLAADQPLAGEEIGFLMKWSGYRFQDVSLDSALHRERRFEIGWQPAGPESPAGWKVKLRDRDQDRMRFDVLRQSIEPDANEMLDVIVGGPAIFAAWQAREPERWPADELVLSWGETLRRGLRERGRRLARGNDAADEEADRGS